MRSGLVAFVLISGLASGAQAAGDAEAGRDKSAVCMGCHGEDGNSFAPMFPRLAGQHAAYLAKQLKDFKSEARQDPTMASFAASLTEQDMADLAAYFAGQKPQVGESTAAPEIVARGKKIYMGGDQYNGVPACASCHSPTGMGNPAAGFPALRTQFTDYVVKQLQDFRSATRNNDHNEMMREIAAKLSDNDIRAVAEYIATLPAE